MKIRSKENLLDFFQEERSWRRKELTNIKSLVHSSREFQNHTVIRSAVLLLYSHWEGYVKKVFEGFFYYLNFKALKHKDLKINLIALSSSKEIAHNLSHKKFNSYLKSVKYILEDCNEKKFKINIETCVDTRSNLNVDILDELLNMLGINTDYFSNNILHIDNRLLKYRNAIAHGERTDNNPEYFVSAEDFDDLYEKINELTDYFEDIIINYLETEGYKAA